MVVWLNEYFDVLLAAEVEIKLGNCFAVSFLFCNFARRNMIRKSCMKQE